MWTKQPETRKQQRMTSFKSKITRRKRKLSNSGGINNVQFLTTQLLDGNTPLLENNIVIVSPNSTMMNKGNKKKSNPAKFYVDEGSNSSVTIDDSNQKLIDTNTKECIGNNEIKCTNWSNGYDVIQNVDSTNNCNADDIIFSPQTNNDSVQMRPKNDGISSVSHSNTMRYSDSYILSNNKNNRDNEKSSTSVRKNRSVYISDNTTDNILDRSDSMKYKSTNSSLYRSRQLQKQSSTVTDPTKMQQRQINESSDNQQKTTKTNDVGVENKRHSKNKKKNAKSKQLDTDYNDSNLTKTSVKGVNVIQQQHQQKPEVVSIIDEKKNKKTTTKDTTSNNHDSYLKRVKSKIYKHSRSDSSVSQNSSEGASDSEKMKINKKDKKNQNKSSKIPKIKNNSIPEESEVKLKKSASTLFLRQYSNLERVRPKSFGIKSSNGLFGITDLVDSTTNILNVPVEQPKLTKSKSSSAINLNLLRSRRNKIIEQSKNCKNADTEFSFIAYGNTLQNNSAVNVIRNKFDNNCVVDGSQVIHKDRPSSWIFGSISEVEGGDRPSQPVSRSSSDKRPDAVTEEVSKSTDLPDLEADSDISHDNVHNVQRARSSQPAINRSESYKEQSQKRRQIRERRKISDPNLSKSNDLDSDHPELSHSGSSSNSSLSSRSTESPQSTSLDAVPGSQSHGSTTLDSDMEIEPDPPDWQSSVSEEVLSRLHPEEKKRQEIINELFHTERSHVRNLRVLETVFYRPLLNNKHLPPEQIELMFSNLEEMLVIHGAFNAKMKKRRKEETVVGDIGELLLSMFDGPEGEDFQRAAATFCARQQLALESLKELRRKDNRLHQFLKDCESDRLCKRFQLKDIIPTGMQRLVKYPLLFESLVKCTERLHESTMRESIPTSSGGSMTPSGPAEELNRLRRAVERSKEILNYVNRAVKEAEDKARLQELQRRIDKTAFEKMEHPVAAEFKNVDLTQHKLIYEGPLTWRINKQKLNLHVVLTEEIIIFLQKQDEKYILKWYNSITGNERSLSPIVKVCTALVRPNATSKDSLFLVNTSHNGAQIYDLIAPSPNEYKIWFKHISDAAEAYKCREGKSRRSELSTPESEGADTSSTDVPAGGDADKSDLLTSGDIASGSGDTQSGSGGDTDSNVTSGENSQRNSGVLDDEAAEKRLTQGEGDTTASAGQEGSGSMGTSKREAQMRLATEDQPLIQPSEVLVNVLPVHIAQPVVTPIEQVRRKDEAIRRALAEKEALVAEILEVPPEEYHMIVDMAGDNLTGEKEPTELVLAAVNQANQLWSVVSESLNISDADAVLATSNQNPLCTSILQKNSFNNIPSVPCHRIHDIATTLNLQLTALLKVVKEREDEREKMRKELHKLREQVDTLHGEQLKLASVDCVDSNAIDGNHDLIQNEDLTNIEENP